MALQQKKIKGVADIVICIDCTGSMEPCISEVKDQIGTLIDTLDNPPDQQRPVDWQLKIMGFRDLNCDSEPWINRDEPLISDIAAAKAQLVNLKHDGGGDEPESALDALWWAASKTNWRENCTKVIVFLSDATCHDTLHESTIKAGAVGNDVSTVNQALASNSIHLYAWGVRCPAWESLKKITRVFYTAVEGGGDGLSSLNFTELMQTLGKTLTQNSASIIDRATKPA